MAKQLQVGDFSWCSALFVVVRIAELCWHSCLPFFHGISPKSYSLNLETCFDGLGMRVSVSSGIFLQGCITSMQGYF